MKIITRGAWRLIIASLLATYLVLLVYSYARTENTTAIDASVDQKYVPASSPETNGGVIGEGKVKANDGESREETRGRAIEAAKSEAILQTLAVFVHPEILVKERGYLLKMFQGKEADIFDDLQIISEEKREIYSYWVKIKAKLRKEVVETLLTRNLLDDRVVLIALETCNKKPLRTPILETALKKKIKEAGYTVVNINAVKKDKTASLVSSSMRGNAEAAKRLGVYYLSDTVIVGAIEASFSEKTQEIYSSHASGRIKMYRIGTAKGPFIMTKKEVKGFGSDVEKSSIDALTKISSALADGAVQSLPPRRMKQVKIILREIGDYASYQKLKKLLASITYVTEVRSSSVDLKFERAVLYARTNKDNNYLLAEIVALKKFVVTEAAESGIYLEARRLN